MVSEHFRDDRSGRYSERIPISSDTVVYFYTFESCYLVLDILFDTEFFEVIPDRVLSEIELVIITSIDIYLDRICRLCILYEWEDHVLHTLTVGLANSYGIDSLCITIWESKLTLISMLDTFDLRIEFFSLYFREELGIMESIEWIEKPRSKREIRHPASGSNRSCPWSASSFIDTDDIVIFHGWIVGKSCFFPNFLYYRSALNPPSEIHASRVIGMRKVWTSSERRRANGSGLLVYLKK